VECQRLLTMEELIHQTGGKCFDCFWPAPSEGKRLLTPEDNARYWLSDEAMKHD
jgi:hypothetical protein